MSLTLSREEMREVTGRCQKNGQRQELDAMGVPYVIRADGWPVVDRRAYHQAMGVDAANDAHVEAKLDLEQI